MSELSGPGLHTPGFSGFWMIMVSHFGFPVLVTHEKEPARTRNRTEAQAVFCYECRIFTGRLVTVTVRSR